MKLFYLTFLLLSSILLSASKLNDHLDVSQINENPEKDTTIYYGNSLEIGADLDGNGKTKKLELLVVSSVLKKRIDSITFKNNYQDYLFQFNKLKPQIVLRSDEKVPPLIISEDPKIIGPWNLENLGDVNNDGKDDIAIVLEWMDLNKTDSCFIYSYHNKKWQKIGSCPIKPSFSKNWISVNLHDIIIQKDHRIYYLDENNKEAEILYQKR